MSLATIHSDWTDQFTKPSLDDLLAGLNKADQALVVRCLDRFEQMGVAQRAVVWHGIPWNWTIAVKSDNDAPIAYLVPEPRRPQLALRFPAANLAGVSLRRLPKPVRDGLLAAKVVNGIIWPEWQLISKTQVDELLALIEIKPASPRAKR
jgi:hypothetical protein